MVPPINHTHTAALAPPAPWLDFAPALPLAALGPAFALAKPNPAADSSTQHVIAALAVSSSATGTPPKNIIDAVTAPIAPWPTTWGAHAPATKHVVNAVRAQPIASGGAHPSSHPSSPHHVVGTVTTTVAPRTAPARRPGPATRASAAGAATGCTLDVVAAAAAHAVAVAAPADHAPPRRHTPSDHAIAVGAVEVAVVADRGAAYASCDRHIT